MAEMILVKDRPHLDNLIHNESYRSVGKDHEMIILEDAEGNRAKCTVDEEGAIEYLHDYLNYDTVKFADNLKSKFNVLWIDQSDLLEYNKNVQRVSIPFTEFRSSLEELSSEFNVKLIELELAENKWERMTSMQKAKVLPLGYLKNYLYSIKGRGQIQMNVIDLLQESIDDRINFGILNQ